MNYNDLIGSRLSSADSSAVQALKKLDLNELAKMPAARVFNAAGFIISGAQVAGEVYKGGMVKLL